MIHSEDCLAKKSCEKNFLLTKSKMVKTIIDSVHDLSITQFVCLSVCGTCLENVVKILFFKIFT